MSDYSLSLRRLEQLLRRGATSNNPEFQDCKDDLLFWLCRAGVSPEWTEFPLTAEYLGQTTARKKVPA